MVKFPEITFDNKNDVKEMVLHGLHYESNLNSLFNHFEFKKELYFSCRRCLKKSFYFALKENKLESAWNETNFKRTENEQIQTERESK